MTRRRVSNPLALAVLSCLSERPMHPYEISTTLRTRGKEESIKLNYGSLYSVVESLRKHGLIREPGDHARGPPARAHRVRDHRGGRRGARGLAGRAALHPGARVHLAGGRAVADGGPASPTRSRGCSSERAERLRMRAARARRHARRATEAGLPELFLVESAVPRAHARRRARVRHRPRRRHPHRRARRHRRVAAHPRAARRRHDASRRCSRTRSATSERRRERSNRTNVGRPRPVREHRPGANTRAGTAGGPTRGALER